MYHVHALISQQLQYKKGRIKNTELHSNHVYNVFYFDIFNTLLLSYGRKTAIYKHKYLHTYVCMYIFVHMYNCMYECKHFISFILLLFFFTLRLSLSLSMCVCILFSINTLSSFSSNHL